MDGSSNRALARRARWSPLSSAGLAVAVPPDARVHASSARVGSRARLLVRQGGSGSYTNTDVHPFRAPSELVSLRLELDATGCGKMLLCVTKRGDGGANVLTRRVAAVRRDTPSTFAAHFVLEVVEDPSWESPLVTSVDATALFMVEPARRVALPGLPMRLSVATLTLELSWGTFVFEKSSADPGGSFADAIHAKEKTTVRLERAAKEPSNLAASY
jgi:hypothetical protein